MYSTHLLQSSTSDTVDAHKHRNRQQPDSTTRAQQHPALLRHYNNHSSCSPPSHPCLSPGHSIMAACGPQCRPAELWPAAVVLLRRRFGSAQEPAILLSAQCFLYGSLNLLGRFSSSCWHLSDFKKYRKSNKLKGIENKTNKAKNLLSLS